jgi:2-polyprenyl-6-methoxyphenol hydroxylase-like FAD-dependent oxidoreductase
MQRHGATAASICRVSRLHRLNRPVTEGETVRAPDQRPDACDVVVVGSRCAGAATAMLLARAGHDVVLVDRVVHPRDTVSTHGLARGAVVQLSRWGLLEALLDSGAPPSRRVRFGIEGDEVVRPIRDKAGVDLLLAPRRYVLDAVLTQEAARSGARVREGWHAVGVLRDPTGRVAGVSVRDRHGRTGQIRARYVVGADGLRSSIARFVDAPTTESHDSDTGLFYGYVESEVWEGYELHLAPSAFAGIFPTHHGQGCVWLSRPLHLLSGLRAAGADRGTALLAELDHLAPGLAQRCRTGPLVGPVRGTGRLPNQLRRPHGPGWALVGDAGYHRDPITGHGITDAFRDADLLARALHEALQDPTGERDALAGYATTRDQLLRPTLAITRALAAFPPPSVFLDLQTRLATALDDEAHLLASLPTWAGDHHIATAA